jgi:hypothetical protein
MGLHTHASMQASGPRPPVISFQRREMYGQPPAEFLCPVTRKTISRGGDFQACSSRYKIALPWRGWGVLRVSSHGPVAITL